MNLRVDGPAEHDCSMVSGDPGPQSTSLPGHVPSSQPGGIQSSSQVTATHWLLPRRKWRIDIEKPLMVSTTND